MAGATISITFDEAQVTAAMTALRELGENPTPLLRAIGVGLAQTTRDRFLAARDPQGQAWKPLLPAYAAIKTGAGILRGAAMSGGLMGSITFQTGSNQVMIGSNKVYAAVHQFGATIRPKRAKALFFALGGAGGVVFGIHARSVKIPARPYLGFGEADRDMVLDVTDVFLTAALGGERLG